MTPIFDSNGFVTGPDNAGTFIDDLGKFLDVAYTHNILVIPVLWNGAIELGEELRGLLLDEDKLDSYIEKVLVPTVNALKDKVALGAWEIVNEPEGSVLTPQSHSEPCFDTTPLTGSGAGWTGEEIPMENWLRFINRQIAAIKMNDPKALATQGAWSEKSQTDNIPGARNYFKDRSDML